MSAPSEGLTWNVKGRKKKVFGTYEAYSGGMILKYHLSEMPS
jgi:hypothetical protein